MRKVDVVKLVGRKLDDVERALIEATVEHCRWNIRQAARMLGVSRRTVYNKLSVYRDRDVTKRTVSVRQPTED